MGVDPWALTKVTMDSLPSVWTSHHEGVGELVHKLVRTTWELEALQSSVEEERREREEHINQLIQILKITAQERDEARGQLQDLLNKISEPNSAELVDGLSYLQPHSPQIWQARGNSTVTESESPSETPNHHSYGSSPAEPFLVPSMHGASDSCTMGLPQQPLFLCENDRSSSMVMPPGAARYDRGDALIDTISAKKPLPEKGKLLETMLKLGPTLETLMVAGPLPHWRNPPPLQSFQVPPVTIKACYPQLLNRAAMLNSSHLIQSSLYEKSNGLSSQMHPASILEFSSTVSLHARASPCVSSDPSFEARL